MQTMKQRTKRIASYSTEDLYSMLSVVESRLNRINAGTVDVDQYGYLCSERSDILAVLAYRGGR